MVDSVIAGTGNSRYLRTSIGADTTWAEALEMLRAGTFPIDLAGINQAGFSTLGTALNSDTLLKSAVIIALGLDSDATPSDAWEAVLALIDAKADADSAVTAVTYDTETKTLSATINGTSTAIATFDFVNAEEAAAAAPVQSVAGKTGTVTLDAGDVAYDETATYNDNTVGNQIQQNTDDITDLKSQIDDVYDVALGAYQSATVSGAAVRFSGAADGVPFKSAVATIDYDANGKTEANIVVGGKNLVAGYYPYSLASATVDGVAGVYLGRATGTGVGTTIYFPCKAGVTYTRSYTDEDTHNRTFWAAFDHLPVVKDFSSAIQSGGDQYTPPIDGYVCLFIKNAVDDTLYTYQQIEVGSIATEFEAAQPIQTINVDWSDVATVYGGTVDAASGTVISTLNADGTPLAEPVVYQFDRTDVYPKAGETTMWADCGNISVEYCLANADPDNSLRGKNILIFGDSITETNSLTIVNDKTTAYAWKNPSNSYVDGDGNTIKYSMWPKILMLNQRCGEIRNYALSGASYISETRTTGNERQNVQYQITVALNDRDNPNGVFAVDDFVPDIVIFALGTNDTLNDTYADAMAKTVLEEDGYTVDVESTIAALDDTKFCESARLAYLRIKQEWPMAQIFCVLPIQRASAEPADTKLENLRKMAGRYGLIIIDGSTESGIVRDLNVYSGLGVYLKDGLHPNEVGQNIMARMIISAMKSHYTTFGAGFNV